MNKFIFLSTILCLSIMVDCRNFGGLNETPEVQAATQAHLEAYKRARSEALSRPRAPQYINDEEEEGEEFFFPSQPQKRVNPVHNFQRKTAPVPEQDYYSTSSLNEPCHGPLCNLKYTEVQSSVVTEGPQYKNAQHSHQQSQQHNYNQQQVDPSAYRRQIPGQDYSQTLIAAAKAYSDIINGRTQF